MSPRGLTAVLAAVVALAGCAAATPAPGSPAPPPPPARSVILISGDGMGAAHREAARLSLAGFDGALEMDRLPVAGLLTTDPRDPKTAVTDSAAAATAWSTGRKTYNGAISVDEARRPLPVLGVAARASGRSTGLVTTSQVTDASPATFFARTPDREQQDVIARQYLDEGKPDVILGGGEDWWRPAGVPGAYPDNPAEDPTEASKGTQGDLVERARGLGYAVVDSPAQLQSAPGPKVLGLFANEEMFQQKPEGQGDVYSPVVDLPTMTGKALDVLSANPQGFFLFVEEEGVDEFASQNNGPRVLQAISRLDATVALARRYVAANPDTLLVVTGDHEAGGLTVEGSDVTDDESGDGMSAEDGPFPVAGSQQSFVMDWTTDGHTGVPVPVTAEGPGAARFGGENPNTFVHRVLSEAMARG